MNEPRTDFELLRAFSREGDQPAFAALARRHLDLVYATALRKTGDAGAAEEVAQNVFVSLARKAWQFAPDDSLAAWLYRAALLESKDWLRGELRRRRRERTAAELATTMNTPDQEPALRALLPLLDEALLSLREKERTALLLRFYENQSLKEVGAALGVGEDAAQKRVASAVQKLTAFFERRGFKSATTATTATALHHTAVSAPATVAASLAQAAAQMAPPALGGLLGLVARCAGLTKVQAAAACVVLVALPVSWGWLEQRRAAREEQRARSELVSAQPELETEQLEVQRLQRLQTELESAATQARAAAKLGTAREEESKAWKQHLRSVLTADHYRWPADSPFVRIPKSMLRQIDVHAPITPPGVVAPEARELLGLAPAERQQVEDALQQHFATLDSLADSAMMATNATNLRTRNSSVSIPKDAVASQGWVVPALGDRVAASAGELQETLHSILGDERWPLVQGQLEVGMDLRRTLGFDVGQDGQAMAVWLEERNGKTVAGVGWSGPNGSYSSSGAALDLFLPGHALPAGAPPGTSPLVYVGAEQLPPAMTQRIQSWLEQQALSRLGKDNGQ